MRFEIAGRLVGPDQPPLVIAEIGINHEGSLEVAIDMVDAAISAGAEIVKLQTHHVDDEMSTEAKGRVPGNADESIFEIMQRCALAPEEERKVFEHVRGRGAICISTPFSRSAADYLSSLDVPAYKIGSGECSNYPLVRHVASKGRPVIMSTGMHTVEEVSPSVDILRRARVAFALLHTTNLYPTPPELVRLGGLTELAEAFPDAIVGLSDHTTTNYACFGAVALGACIIERHFTDRADRPGPDIVCSSDPDSLQDLIRGCKSVFLSRGGSKKRQSEEDVTRSFALASVAATRGIRAGERLTEENIWVKRPAGGAFGPTDYDGLLGRTCLVNVTAGTQLPREALYGTTTP